MQSGSMTWSEMHDDVANEACMWSLRKEPKTQVCGPRTRNPHIHIYCHCYGDGHSNRHSHIQCCVEHMHHGWVYIRSTPLCVEQRQERIVWSTYGSQKLKNLKRSRRISL